MYSEVDFGYTAHSNSADSARISKYRNTDEIQNAVEFCYEFLLAIRRTMTLSIEIL